MLGQIGMRFYEPMIGEGAGEAKKLALH